MFTAKPKCNPVFKAAEKCIVFPEASANLTVKVHGWEWEFALDFAADLVVVLNLTPAASLKHKRRSVRQRKCTENAMLNQTGSDVCCEHKLIDVKKPLPAEPG